MPVRKTSRSSSKTREGKPFDQRKDQQKPAERRRVIIKIVPEPQPTPPGQPVPTNEILRRRRVRRED